MNASLPPRVADFETLIDAMDYAAAGETGLNFYGGRGEPIEVLPYGKLRERAVDLARRLVKAGLQPGERVALLAETDGDFARLFYACQYAGLIPVPLPLPMAFGGKESYIAHIRRMIESADAVAAFAPAEFESWLGEAVKGLGLKIAGTSASLQAYPADPVALPKLDPDSACYLQFSSGSTRFPLGVVVTHRALMANTRAMAHAGTKARDGDRGASWLPLYHDMGLVGFFLAPMLGQATVDLMSTRDFVRRPLTWLKLISQHGATMAFSPSFGYELCVRQAKLKPQMMEGLDLSTWRIAGIGGDMIRPQVLESFAECFAGSGFRRTAFVPSYGMAEATLALSFAPLDQGPRTDSVDASRLEHEDLAVPLGSNGGRRRDFVSCGPILPDHALEIRDAKGAVLPERRVGRIFVRGPSVMQGYFAHPQETRRILSEDGWLDTGDLGYLLDGEVVITGRAKDLIIVNGRNIWPQDLEWAAEMEIPDLRDGDVAAFSFDTQEEEKIVALVQCRTQSLAEREKLKAEVAGMFRARHGVEVSVVLVPPRSLPRTSSGKLSRTRARDMFFADAFQMELDPPAAE